MRKLLKQLVKFFGVTQIAWLLDLAVYTVLFQFSGVYYIISKAISYTCGAVLSYVLNRKFTFTGDNPDKAHIAALYRRQCVFTVRVAVFHACVWQCSSSQ